jgi:hypothetical protein
MFYEIRTEHARPGHGPELARCMSESVVPLHRENGMDVLGAFTVTGDENSFVWIRRFEDEAHRARVLEAVHGHPRCAALAATVSALSERPPSTLRLEPAPGPGPL